MSGNKQDAREPSSIEERFVWMLDQMIRSSKISEKYFKLINDFYSQYIVTNIEPDPTTMVVTKDKEMYDAIHADLIFRVLGVIESFQGAMAAAWKFTASGKRDLEKIQSILVDPRGHRGNIEKILNQDIINEKEICRLFAIPLLSRVDEKITKESEKRGYPVVNLLERVEEILRRSITNYAEYIDSDHSVGQIIEMIDTSIQSDAPFFRVWI